MRAIRIALVLAGLTIGACRHTPAPRAAPPSDHALPPPAATATATLNAAPAPSATPLAAPGRNDVVTQLVALEDAFCARVESGRVYCWGVGVNGQIGDGARANRDHPTAVSNIRHATAIAARWHRACAVEAGRVWCWGESFESVRGEMLPHAVPAPIGDENDVVEATLGFAHVWMRHANGDVTYRIAYPGANAAVMPVALPAPATALASGDDAFCASTSAGVFCQSYSTMSSGGTPLAPLHRVMDAAPVIAMSARQVCCMHDGRIDCADVDNPTRVVTIPATSPRAMVFVTPPLFESRPSPLCVVGEAETACLWQDGYPPRQDFSPGGDVASLVGNEHHCALLRSGEVRCESDGHTFGRVLIGTAAPTRAGGVLASELISEDSIVEAARLGANGRVEYCAVRRAAVGTDVSNRQCFALEPDAPSVIDMPAWHETPPTVGWTWSTIEVVRADGRHEVPFVHSPDADEDSLEAVVGPRGNVAAGIARVGGTRTVSVVDVASGATLYTRNFRRALTQTFAVLGGLLVNTWANDMVDGGTFSIEFLTVAGARQRLGECRATPDIPCAWELSPTRVGILTMRGAVIFDGPNARREVTGFDPPGEAVRWLLEDPARHRLYAVHDQPLGAVDVFDRVRHQVVRTVAPLAP